MSCSKAFKCNNIDKKIKANDAILKSYSSHIIKIYIFYQFQIYILDLDQSAVHKRGIVRNIKSLNMSRLST